MCGFIGIYGPEGSDVAPEIYEGLIAVQHRGQDAAGIITFTDAFHLRKSKGLVIEVFEEDHMRRLRGNLGVGHVRYPTVGGTSEEDAQPFHHTYPLGVAMAHNGNVTNVPELMADFFANKGTRLNSTCDVELILWVFQDALAQRFRETGRVEAADVFAAVRAVYEKVKGAYSVVATIADLGMVAFRDPFGIKPIVFGERHDENGTSFACASESVVLDVNGYERTLDIGPGEAVFIGRDRSRSRRSSPSRRTVPASSSGSTSPAPTPSSTTSRSTRRAAFRSGAREAVAGRGRPDAGRRHPDPGLLPRGRPRDGQGARPALPRRPGQEPLHRPHLHHAQPGEPQLSVRRKLNPIELEFDGKDVLLVDDSIVRGNTSKRIVDMARAAGAKKVYFGVTSPPLVAPCPYGIDMASKREFIAEGRTNEEIAEEIGVDHLVYLDREAMNAAARKGNDKLENFCNACFTGDYPTGDITVERLRAIETERESRRDNVPAS